MKPRGCNAQTYRQKLGANYNAALFALTSKINAGSLASNLTPAEIVAQVEAG